MEENKKEEKIKYCEKCDKENKVQCEECKTKEKNKKIAKVIGLFIGILLIITITLVYNTIYNGCQDDFESDGMVLYKPIIYLYPESETEVLVKLGVSERLTCTYPKYEEDGWKVLAKSNGDLVDLKTGRNLYSLYWEGINSKEYNYDLKEGFIVKGEDTIKFLEEKLEILGLTQTEAEEFIIYWLPKMEDNKYNYIRFQTVEEIEENMPLEITPKPDTTIRIMMEWKALDEYVEVKEQKLETPERKGFVAVEWGGTEIK